VHVVAVVGVRGDDFEATCLQPLAIELRSIVKRVPSRPTRVMPAAASASAVPSAMCSSGSGVAPVIASATLCMVLVHNTMKSAPPSCSERAATAMASPAASQWPACCSVSISWKSTLCSSSLAECRPPSVSRTVWLMIR